MAHRHVLVFYIPDELQSLRHVGPVAEPGEVLLLLPVLHDLGALAQLRNLNLDLLVLAVELVVLSVHLCHVSPEA